MCAAAHERRATHPHAHNPHPSIRSQDISGAALDDPVTPPPEVQSVIIDPAHSSVDGAVPAGPGSRAHVHAQLAVVGLRDVGLSAAPGKVVVGDPVVSLGMRVSRAERQMNCPALKRASMLDSGARQRRAAIDQLTAERAAADTLVGRAVNLSQVFPELNSVLHGGYAVTRSRWVAGERARRPSTINFRRGSPAHSEWVGFLDVVDELVRSNTGVSICPLLSFPPRDSPGTLTITTDASGIDGVGGYAFHAAHPHRVWIVSEVWPRDIQEALDAAAAHGDAGATGAPAISMPAAELFGSFLVAAAAVDDIYASGGHPSAIYAVTDCDPAADALNAATSGVPQMRRLLAAARSCSQQWLAVSVPREANVDADRLSHPHLYDAVASDARAAGLDAHRLRIDASSPLWDELRAAAALGTGRPSQ